MGVLREFFDCITGNEGKSDNESSSDFKTYTCVPSKPHEGHGQGLHVDNIHYEDGKSVGACRDVSTDEKNKSSDPSYVKDVQEWYGSGSPGHPKG